MILCYVSFEYPPQFGGGIGTYVHNICRNLTNEGHEIHVVTFNPGDLLETERVDGVILHRVRMNDTDMETINTTGNPNLSTLLYWSVYSEKVYRKLRELVLQHRFDAIEFCDYRGEAHFSVLAKYTRGEFKDVPLVIRLHTPLFVLNKYNAALEDPGMHQLVQFENFPMLLADAIVSPSRVLADLTQEEFDLKAKIEVLPHPIDLESFPPSKNNPNRSTVLYVGRLEHRKGVVDLIRAAIGFLTAHPEAMLRLIGGDTQTSPNGGSMKAYLQSLIPQELKSRFDFIDRMPREDVLKEYGMASFCVFPSLFENFPNVCLEAMASGTPVVVSHFSGMAEMIEDGKSGLVFKAGDYLDLQDKMERLFNITAAERKSMGQAARKRVELLYSSEAVNRLQVEYFRGLSKSPKMHRPIDTSYQPGLVSIVIPCFNHGAFLMDTIESVRNNSYKNVEIIVVNDGSTDAQTLEVLQRIPKDVKVIHQENAGLSAARNNGILASNGEYILPLDADDLILPTFLEKTVSEMERDASLGFVYTYVQNFGAADGIWQTPDFDPNLLLVSNICVATSLFRRVAFDQVGGYKTDMIYGFEDWDFWIYMVEHGWRGKCVHEPLFLYRKHESSMLSNSQKYRQFLYQKLVDHHYQSFQRSMVYVIVEKDRQFFDAHMSSYANFQQLHSVMNSKAWKLVVFLRKVKDKLRHLLGVNQ